MTALGRQGEACLPESWQTQKIHGEAEVRQHSGAVLVKCVWLAIISVLLTVSIIPVEKITPKDREGGNRGAVSISIQVIIYQSCDAGSEGGLFPVESLS